MKLYNSLIDEVNQILSENKSRELATLHDPCWEMLAKNELILAKQSAFELGADGMPSTSTSLVTTEAGVIEKDEITLIGADLCDIKADSPFARIMLIHIDDVGEDSVAYKAVRDMEYVKYDVIPRGYMQRTSFMEFREQVRVSKDAVNGGISFSNIGSAYIAKLKENSKVKHVHIIFITDAISRFDDLRRIAVKVDGVTKTLNHVLTEMDFDCKTCALKSICDEVEGLRELHFKNKK